MRFELNLDPSQPMALDRSAVSLVVNVMAGNSESKDDEKPQLQMLSYDGQQLSAEAAQKSTGMIAVVPIWGVLTPSGYYGTSLDRLPLMMQQLDDNAAVTDILLDVRSPGGTVVGTPEVAASIRRVRDNGKTNVVSIANGMMASAAMWIGAAASEVWITPSGEAGSIGVISMYADWSKAFESMGIKIEITRVPANKARFSGYEPMTDEMRSHIETRIKASYVDFKKSMAANRGVSVDDVESKFGNGEMLGSKEALKSGLIDKIGTVSDVLSYMAKNRRKQSPMSNRAKLARLELECAQ